MIDLDLPLRNANCFVMHGPLLRRRVRLQVDILLVYSVWPKFDKKSFVVKPSWVVRVVRKRRIEVVDGEYFRVTLDFKNGADRDLLESALSQAVRDSEDERLVPNIS